MARVWWVIAIGAAVGVVLTAVAVYELLVVGTEGVSTSDAVTSHVFIAAVAAAAGVTSTVLLGTAAGVGVAELLASRPS